MVAKFSQKDLEKARALMERQTKENPALMDMVHGDYCMMWMIPDQKVWMYLYSCMTDAKNHGFTEDEYMSLFFAVDCVLSTPENALDEMIQPAT